MSWTQLIRGLPTPLNPSWQLNKAVWSPDNDDNDVSNDQDYDAVEDVGNNDINGDFHICC